MADGRAGRPGPALGRLVRLALPTVLALAALSGAAWLGWRVGVKGELLRLREIRFAGLGRVTSAELGELSPVQPGDHLLLADLDAMRRALARNPWIASVEIRRRLPPALEVTVVERRARALVELSGLSLVDERGRVFKRAAPGDGLDLPVVTGLAREDHVARRAEVEAVLAGALALLDRWREAGLERALPVSELHFDRDLAVTAWAGDAGTEIRLGQGDLPAKLERLARVLGELEAAGRSAAVIHLDNRRHPDWVPVRLAGASAEAEGRPGVVADGRRPRGR